MPLWLLCPKSELPSPHTVPPPAPDTAPCGEVPRPERFLCGVGVLTDAGCNGRTRAVGGSTELYVLLFAPGRIPRPSRTVVFACSLPDRTPYPGLRSLHCFCCDWATFLYFV